MELVVKIDEETYEDIKKGKVYTSFRDVPQEAVLAIANGTLLPKGHGRLIDADKEISKICGSSCGCHLEECGNDAPCHPVTRIESAPTIIEADKEYEAEVITRGNCMMCGKEFYATDYCPHCGVKMQEEGE